MKAHRGKAAKATDLTWKGSQVQSLLPEPKFPTLKPGQALTIPSGYAVIPAMEFTNGQHRPYWVVTNRSQKTREKPVKASRRSRTA